MITKITNKGEKQKSAVNEAKPVKRKRDWEHETNQKKDKRQRTEEEQIQIHELKEQKEMNVDDRIINKTIKEEDKNEWAKEEKYWSKARNGRNESRKTLKTQLKINEENKENIKIEEESKILMPFEIK